MAVETPEFAGMVARMIRAYGRRVADADPVDLARMVELLRVEVEAATSTAVAGQRERHSWAEIGLALGTTRQAAQQRFG